MAFSESLGSGAKEILTPASVGSFRDGERKPQFLGRALSINTPDTPVAKAPIPRHIEGIPITGVHRSGLLLTGVPGAAHPEAIPAPAGIDTLSGKPIIPTDAELLAYAPPPAETAPGTDSPQRGSRELATALATPKMFAISEAEKNTPNDKGAAKVLNRFRKGKGVKAKRREKALARRVTETVQYDRHSDTQDVITQSRPGPVENAVLGMTALLDDSEIRPMAGSVVFAQVDDLLGANLPVTGEAPSHEMPDLSEKLIAKLPQFARQRHGIYGILAKLSLPDSQRTQLARFMGEQGDLGGENAQKIFVKDPARKNHSLLPEEQAILDGIPRAGEPVVYKPNAYDETDVQRDLVEPGLVENVGIAILDSVYDPVIREHADELVIAPVKRLLRERRLHYDTHPVKLPDMPDLTDAVLSAVASFSEDEQVRKKFYGLLEEITISDHDAERLMTRMDAHHDLDHPLAFQATVQLAKNNPGSQWLATQRERRNALLYSLQGTNQDMYERYDELHERAKGLVYSGDPLDPREGKVGYEVEFYASEFIKEQAFGVGPVDTNFASADAYAEAAHRQAMRYGGNWIVDIDGMNYEDGTHHYYNELKTSDIDADLSHDLAYLDQLTRLRQMMGDTARYVTTIHLHLDNTAHPNVPTLGHLFAGYNNARFTVAASKDYPTWELRGFQVPRESGNIHPGRIEDLILMNIRAADEAPTPRTQLVVATDKPMDVKQLTWGHLATHIDDPEGRLAALKLMEDEKALSGINPFGFMHSVHIEDRKRVATALRSHVEADEDKVMCDFLWDSANGDVPMAFDEHTLRVAKHVAEGTDFGKVIDQVQII